jgi:lipopolysaccharide heptosyltransferase III
VGQTLGLSIGRRVVLRAENPHFRSSVDTIIIFRIGSLGDTVVALPCLHQVARKYSNSRRILVTDVPASQKAASAESILGNSGLIDRAIYFPPPPRTIRDILKLRTQIRETQARTLVYIADRNIWSTLRDVCFFQACGIRHVIGAPLSRDLRYPRVDPATGELEREAERLARCLAPLGPIDLAERAFWELHLQPSEVRAADKCLAPLGDSRFFAINAGGKVRSKDWGNENWIALLRLMSSSFSSYYLVFIGSKDEFDRSAELAARWPGRTLNLCGVLTPRESAAAIKRAILFIGHDSGPMHLAAAVGVPCVALFGDFNKPRWWHPNGEGHRVIHNMKGVREISPEEVYAAVRSTIADVDGRLNNANFGVVPKNRLLHTK